MVSDRYNGLKFFESSNVTMHGKAARKPGRSWTVRVASLAVLSILLLTSTVAAAIAANFVGTGGLVGSSDRRG